jgi:hypothetical protein
VLALTTTIAYVLRIESLKDANMLTQNIEQEIKKIEAINSEYNIQALFVEVSTQITEEALQLFGEDGDDVSLNKPLRENLIVLLTSISLGLHVLICGKPGTSKTLSVEIASKILSQTRTSKVNLK